jgi:hypothetical protein
MEVSLIPTSSPKVIDESLKNIAQQIEAQSPTLSVLLARQLRYNLQQTLVEVTVTQPREFNVLEEFIIRAGIEFDPPPTIEELASVLGLDPIFIQSTVTTLQALQTLEVKPTITVTSEGRLFYEKGTVPQPPYSTQLYAIADPLENKLVFQSEPLNDVMLKLPDLGKYVTINTFIDISSLRLEEIQESIKTSGLGLHVPESGKILSSYNIVAPTKIVSRNISLFVICDVLEDKLSIQLRKGKQILETASNWLEVQYAEGKVSWDELHQS